MCVLESRIPPPSRNEQNILFVNAPPCFKNALVKFESEGVFIFAFL